MRYKDREEGEKEDKGKREEEYRGEADRVYV